MTKLDQSWTLHSNIAAANGIQALPIVPVQIEHYFQMHFITIILYLCSVKVGKLGLQIKHLWS